MRRLWPCIAMLVSVSACGDAATSAPSAPAAASLPTSAAPSAPGPAASLAAGSIKYRVVNLTAAPVDVYVRSQGKVVAAPVAMGVASGTFTAGFAPPEAGAVVVLKAGATDPTCVIGCTFLAESSTNAGEGNQRTIVVRGDGSTDYWEYPKPASVATTGNALRPADPAQALVFVIAQAVTDAQFGLRLADTGVKGCRNDVEASNLLIGGTNVEVFGLKAGGASVTIHANTDKDCAGSPVGGPFTVTAAVGSRTYLFLSGTAGSMKGLVVPIP